MPDAHVHRLADANAGRAGRRRGQRPAPADVQQRHRGLDLQADRGPRRLLPQRRGRRGRLRPPRRRRPATPSSGRCPFREQRLRRHPARHDPPLAPGRRRRAVLALLPHARRDRDAQPLPQPLRPAARARPVLPARLPPPDRARDRSTSRRRVRAHAARARRLPELRARPPPVRRRGLGRLRLPVHVQRDDFEPRAGRFHLPPPAHQTFQGPNFVICTFAPRMLDWDPTAVPLPYHHSNIQSEEVMFYADGDYAARKGVDDRLPDAAPLGPAARPAARHGREGARRQVAPTSSPSCGTPSGR